jgi:hypothetical protein
MLPLKAPQDRYRLPTVPEELDNVFPTTEIAGEVYDAAKTIFTQNKGHISTKELKAKLELTYEQAVAVMDLLKQDIRPETIIAWASENKEK